jgi:hypothetical protein
MMQITPREKIVILAVRFTTLWPDLEDYIRPEVKAMLATLPCRWPYRRRRTLGAAAPDRRTCLTQTGRNQSDGATVQQSKGLRGIEWVSLGSEGPRKLCIS